jgi:hypothetical protein
MDHERPDGAETLERGRQPASGSRIGAADDLTPDPGRIAQRTEQVEDGADTDLAPGRAGMAHRRMVVGREQKGEPVLDERACGLARRLAHGHAERLQHIGAARRRGDRPVAVLRHRYAGGRDDQRRSGRDIERAAAVAAGAAGVDRCVGCLYADHPLAHRPREAHQLVGGLAAHPQRNEEAAQLRRRGLPIHHGAHRLLGLRPRERPAVDHSGEGASSGIRATRRRCRDRGRKRRRTDGSGRGRVCGFAGERDMDRGHVRRGSLGGWWSSRPSPGTKGRSFRGATRLRSAPTTMIGVPPHSPTGPRPRSVLP